MGKIKTLNDPVSQVPFSNREFYWSFFSALFLTDYVNLAPYEQIYPYDYNSEDNYYELIPGLRGSIFSNCTFQRRDSVEINLFPTEKFYLYNLTYDAKLTTQQYSPQYQLKGVVEIFNGEEKENIKTDGRYYTYTTDRYGLPYREETLDIGFNFIKINGLDNLKK